MRSFTLGSMTSRSRLSIGATFCWALGYAVLVATLRFGWLGEAAFFTLFLIGAGVLWNWDGIATAWREDRSRKREQDAR